MDPAVKTAMAFCVILAGVCAALLFRRDPPGPASPAPPATAELLSRSRAAAADTLPKNDLQDAGAAERSATVVKPLDRAQLPPPLAPIGSEGTPSASTHGTASIDMMLPTAQQAHVHRIVDGDTLPALAERYLGSPSRAREIFDANRSVLSDPELLPIAAVMPAIVYSAASAAGG